ncbi:MAG: di-heme oxidoredictase family protein, partial [bacterium]
MMLSACLVCLAGGAPATADSSQIGREVSIPTHLVDGQELNMPVHQLIDFGRKLFVANWTIEEGGGRPLTKGTGAPLTDPNDPLLFPRNFNRISGPDSNSCAGCHNAPFGIPGGGGDIVGNVFVLGQRFDFANFDGNVFGNTVSSRDETGALTNLDKISNSRATIGMFGSGYIEMFARQITADLQALRDAIPPGGSAALASSGIVFGTLKRNADGSWDTSAVEGLAAPSLATSGAADPPSLIMRPFHQAGNVI